MKPDNFLDNQFQRLDNRFSKPVFKLNIGFQTQLTENSDNRISVLDQFGPVICPKIWNRRFGSDS